MFGGTLRQADNVLLPVAIKRLQAGAPAAALTALEREVEVLKRSSVKCPHVVQYHGTCNKDGRLCLVMKRFEQSLTDCIRAAPACRLPEPQAVGLAIQLFTALAELHDTGIVSRDIKPK